MLKHKITKMKNLLFIILHCIFLSCFYSCSSNDTEVWESTTVQLQDYYTDNQNTALEKALSDIDDYNDEHGVREKTSVITFVLNINDCPAKIIQSTEQNSSEITQKLTTYCRVNTSYLDDYMPSPDYLTRNYTRALVVSRKEILSTVVRRYSGGAWSDWTDYTHNYKASSNHGKNIAFFGGSFAHNMRDHVKNSERFGFDYNGKTTSLHNLISDIFACKHTGNYAQSGHGVFSGYNQNTDAPFFKYNMYEQIKYAFEFSKEKGFCYDVFILCGGINDCAINAPIGYISAPAGDHSYIASYKKAIEYIKSTNPQAQIYMITSFPVFNNSRSYDLLYKYIDANIKLSELYNIPLFDIYNHQFFTDENYTSYYLTDKVHPNGEGYRVVSSHIIDLLNK